MLPLTLLRDVTFSAAVLLGICVNMAYYGTVFVLSLFLQRVHGDTPLQAGLAFLPLTGAVSLFRMSRAAGSSRGMRSTSAR